MNKTVSASHQTSISRQDSSEQSGSPLWFFRFFVGYTVYTLVLLGLLYVDFLGHLWAPDTSWNSPIYRLFIGLVLVPAGIVIALLILRRTRRNVIGLFLLMWAAAVMQNTLRSGSPMQVLTDLFNTSWIGVWLLPLYFPDGTTYPLRFQKWVRIHSVITSIFFVGVAFFTSTVPIQIASEQIIQAANPLQVAVPQIATDIVGTMQALTWISAVLLIIPSIILRFRASRRLVRQQIKVFVWAFGIAIGIFILFFPLFSTDWTTGENPFGIFAPIFIFYSAILFPAMPFAVVGYAILRHKLYDIDIIIRRTLQYGAITALLALVYFGGVALFQSLFSVVTGEESPLAVVVSTLVIAALFIPLRKRVQVFVDRRFYRQKYDAERTLEQFGETMRDEVNLDDIQGKLLSVVDEIIQPEHISLWLAHLGSKGESTWK
jgi:hypothetical protein